MEEENIITVRNRNLQKADEAFADFMFMLESYLNEKAAAIPGGGDTLGFRPIFSRYYRGEILWG
mgnify:CR=1 FL=1